MAAETQNQLRMPFRYQIQCIAQMQCRNRPAGAFEFAVAGSGKGESRTMKPFAQTRGEDADDTLVPLRIVEAQGVARRHVFNAGQCRLLHVGLDVAALAVQLVELACDVAGADRIVGGQAFDAQRHVRQPPGGIESRTGDKTQVIGARSTHVASGGIEQCGDAGMGAAGAHALQALLHQQAVVVIEADHIGDGAQRDQIQQGAEIGFGFFSVSPAMAQLGAQRQHQVEHHADAGEALAREFAARLVGVDDAPGVGQGVAGQVVVGDQHFHAQAVCFGDAVDAGDAVVDGDQDVGFFLFGGEADDFRRQAVTVIKAVGYQIVHLSATAAQRTQSDRAGSGAVGVIVGNDQQFFTTGNGIGQQDGHGADVAQTFRRYEPFQVGIELRLIADAARSIDAR